MSQTIRFQHPDARDSYYCMVVENEDYTATQIRNLEAIGYIVVEVSRPAVQRYPQRSEQRLSARR